MEKYPYALIIDDIQKDDAVHHYDWNGLLEEDLRIVKTEVASSPQAGLVYDVTLIGITLPKNKKDPEPAVLALDQVAHRGSPLLLVRLLDCKYDATAKDRDPVLHDSVDNKKKILTLPCDAVSPDYKILLYPYRKGDPLPTTMWKADHSSLTISLPGQQDTLAFSATDSGKTNIVFNREGSDPVADHVEVTKPIAALADLPK